MIDFNNSAFIKMKKVNSDGLMKDVQPLLVNGEQIPTISIRHIAALLGDTEAMVLKVYNHIVMEKEDSSGAVNAAL